VVGSGENPVSVDAMTWAKDSLSLMRPLKYWVPEQARHGDSDGMKLVIRRLKTKLFSLALKQFLGFLGVGPTKSFSTLLTKRLKLINS